MSEQTQAASSPAEVDVFNGEQVSLAEYSQYRQSGELPDRFKPAEPAESAPADAQPPQGDAVDEDQSDIAPDSDKGNDNQESPQKSVKKHRTAEDRVAQLEAAIEREWEKPEPDLKFIGQAGATLDKIKEGQKRKAEPAPVVQPQSQPQPVPQQYTRPKPTDADKNPDGSPKYTDFVDFVEDLADWKTEQRLAERDRQQAEQARAQRFAARNDEARQRFGEEYETRIKPMYIAIQSNPEIHDVLKGILDESELLPDLMDKFDQDAKAKDKFYALAKNDAFAAVKYIGELEASARQELAGRTRNEKGQFTAQNERPAPEKRQTAAPKPPSPVSGGSSKGAFDVNDDSLPIDQWTKGRWAQVDRQKR